MSNVTAMEADTLAALRRQLAWQRAVLGLVLVSMAVMAGGWFFSRSDVIRTRGVVIVDAEGHDRILIGAPVPVSVDRKRKDAETAGAVFLGPDGADRLIVGEAPGPMIKGKSGTRIAAAVGLTLHDPKGNERGGIGFLGNGRAVVALDRASGDAVGMMVDDATDFAGIAIAYPAPAADWAFKLGTTGREMAFDVYDPQGAIRGELKLNGSETPAWKLSPAPVQQP
jgi:predicted regulator of Ras-like GTPase activity (Roadblock/LC7/MglB family)